MQMSQPPSGLSRGFVGDAAPYNRGVPELKRRENGREGENEGERGKAP